MQKADFFRKKCKFAWIVKGLKLKQIFWNFVQQLNTQHTFHPLTPNTIKAFKSRAQKPFLVCRKKPPPPPPIHKIEFEKCFSLFYIISTEKTIYFKNWILIAVLWKLEHFQICSVFLYTLYMTTNLWFALYPHDTHEQASKSASYEKLEQHYDFRVI
jgi:hypothetical protein